MLCAGILTGCDLLSGGNSATLADSNQSIRPCKIDMAGVQGFAIVESTSNAPRTKADRDGDGVDDDMPNENGVVNTSPYSLYTIDENGDLQVSIFYFEAAPSEDGQVNNGPNEQVLKELTGVLQIVPSLVTDLGKYILFSGCQYQILDSDISDEARAICESFIQNNMWGHRVYMIRKSDGALFDLSNQPIFSYLGYGTGFGGWGFYHEYLNTYSPTSGMGERWSYIPTYTYLTSEKNDLFVRGADPTVISKIEDNGDAITVSQMTQASRRWSYVRNFAIDKDENVYDFFDAGKFEGRKEYKTVTADIYYANGGFDVYEFKSNLITDSWPMLFDIIDVNQTSYIFLIARGQKDNHAGIWVLSASIGETSITPIAEEILTTEWCQFYGKEGLMNYHYLGYNNNCFNWYLPFPKGEKDIKPENNPCDIILSYDQISQQWSLRQISAGLMNLLSSDYDAFVSGAKCYGVNANRNIIEVTEIDIISETSSKYTLQIDMPTIVSPDYNARMVQDVPYLTIDGRNTENGAGVSITVNLINGETNSSFAQDGRNVVSFFRIN